MSTPPTTRPAHTLGTLVRELREAAGLTRQQMEAQTGVGASTIRSFETGRHKPTARMLRRLMKSPAMIDLPELAEQVGLALDLGQGDPPKDEGANPQDGESAPTSARQETTPLDLDSDSKPEKE